MVVATLLKYSFFLSQQMHRSRNNLFREKKMFSDEKAIWKNNVLKAAQNVIYLLINKFLCD